MYWSLGKNQETVKIRWNSGRFTICGRILLNPAHLSILLYGRRQVEIARCSAQWFHKRQDAAVTVTVVQASGTREPTGISGRFKITNDKATHSCIREDEY